MPAPTALDKLMSDEPHHECGFAMLRLLKPAEYYEEKYGTNFFGLNRMYMMMEKQRNRGQDGCGLGSVKLDVPPGTRYIHCQKSIEKDPITDVFTTAQKCAAEKLKKAPQEARLPGTDRVDPHWVKENVPFAAEVYIGHVRYGTDSDNSIDRCHPVLRESNWMTRNLLLAGNFNITNNEDLFSSLVQIGQHPRELSDTVMLLEKIGHFVDKENNDLYVKYSATGQAPRTCFSLIAENMSVAQILRRASTDWDGGYCFAGALGHGDSFVMRDPSGIRPAFYMANDEVVVVASEAPLIQSVFNAPQEQVHPLPPGQAIIIKRSGDWSLQRILPAKQLMQCSFERIYFSRGNDAGVYRERERLGRLMIPPLLKMLEAGGDTLANAVLTWIPNTSELAYMGLVKEAQDEMARKRAQLLMELKGKTGADLDTAIQQVNELHVRHEKVVHKDAKIRTFIQEDSSREQMTMHAYDIHYGTVRPQQDVLVAIDDSIVRGNTLKNAILRTLDRLGPKRIIICSSCPQIRFPDVYGIDMAKMGDLAAFKAAISLLQERNMGHVLTEVYRACRAQLSRPLASGDFVNHVKRIYEPFTPEEISARIVEQVRPSDCNAEIDVLFNSVEALHEAMPEHKGDWYFTGDYPTNGGTKVCCRAFVLWMEGSDSRCYGVSSASSTMQNSVLVIGNGGAEHALAWKVATSHDVGRVFVAPGNAGTAGYHPVPGAKASEAQTGHHETAPLVPVDIPLTPPFRHVLDFCKEQGVVLAVLGGLQAGSCQGQVLSEGLGDVLRGAGVPVFGPSQGAAEIESSPAFSSAFAQRHGVKMAECSPSSEDWPRGCEFSVLAFSDGTGFKMLPFAVQDQKWSLDDDRGQWTDGMGAFAPSPMVDAEMLEDIETSVVRPVLEGLEREGRAFVGCLHLEMLRTAAGPQVVQFRSHMGDPVAQAALRLLDCDLYQLCAACAAGKMSEVEFKVREDASAVAVVMASGGYPGPFRRGQAITGIERALCVPGTTIFCSGADFQPAQPSRGSSADQQPAVSKTWSSGTLGKIVSKTNYVADLHVPRGPTVTSGGRVLTVVSVGRGLHEARERAYVGVRAVQFTDGWYRHDVAALAAMTTATRGSKDSPQARQQAGSEPKPSRSGLTYQAAGVDRSACEAVVSSAQALARRTLQHTIECTDGEDASSRSMRTKVVGYAEDSRYQLVTTAQTLGTKLRIAVRNGLSFEGMGTDLVALCANEIAARGAHPLFFQQHISTDQVDAQHSLQMVKGAVDACVEAGYALLDTGLAELPGVFAPGGGSDYVGFAVGRAERDRLLPRTAEMSVGDELIALPASGLHANGYSLVRFIVRAAGLDYRKAAPFDPTRTLAESLLTPARIYAGTLLAVAREGLLLGAGVVASGGLQRCLDGVLPAHLSARLHASTWELPAAQRWLAAIGKIRASEMAATFNCGLGVVLVVAAAQKARVLEALRNLNEEPLEVGQLVGREPGQPSVEVSGADRAWPEQLAVDVPMPFPDALSSLQDPWTISRKRVMVLSGCEEISPLPALAQALALPASGCQLLALVSTHPDSPAMTLARSQGLPGVVLGEGRFATSEFCCEGLDDLDGLDGPVGDEVDGDTGAGASLGQEFSTQLDAMMDLYAPDILVLLDDVDATLLTRAFLQRHFGKVILVHASLLPAFPGRQPLEAALNSGTCMTGCTVAFAVTPPSPGAPCHGPLISQEAVRIHPSDTVSSLRSRLVAECESPSLRQAVQFVASGSVALTREDEKAKGFSLKRSDSFSLASGEAASPVRKQSMCGPPDALVGQ